MNKISVIVIPAVLILFGSSVFAQDTNPYSNSAQVQRMMMARYGGAGGQAGMPGMMTKEKIEKFVQSLLEMGLLYKMMEQPTMVPVDNGIVVAYGNTLRKYDKDLNVIKEVDLDVNVDGMQELAARFAKKYSNDLMDLMGGMTGAPGATSAAATSGPDASKPYDPQREAEIQKEIEQMK